MEITGIAVEQHPDRAQLFMQWHQFEWSVGWDLLDTLRLGVVPVIALLDERLVVKAVNPKPEEVARFAGRLDDQMTEVRRSVNDVNEGLEILGPPLAGGLPIEQETLEAAHALALWG